MHLSDAELKTFDEDGYLFFPGKFLQAEAALLKQDSETVFAMDCVFRGDPATRTDGIRPGIPVYPATPKFTWFKLLRGDL